MSDFKAECTKFDFRWGSGSDPNWGAPQILRGILLTGQNGIIGREGKKGSQGRARELKM